MRKCLLIAVIIWIAIITWFSNQPLKESTAQTYAFLTKMNLAEQQDLVLSQTEEIRSLKHLVRKAAHFGLYFGLGTLIGLTVYGLLRIKDGRFFWFTWGGGTLWGIVDEIHQFFVPGRSMQVQDMLLDSSGVLLAAVVLLVLVRAYERMKGQRLEEKRVLQLEHLFD